MTPAKHAGWLAVLFAVFFLYSVLAIARVVDDVNLYAAAIMATGLMAAEPVELGSRAEAGFWFAGAAVLLVASAALYIVMLARERAEAKSHAPLNIACQKTRNAAMMTGVLVKAALAITILTLLAVIGVVAVRDSLVVTAAVGPLIFALYLASAVPYAPLPRRCPPSLDKLEAAAAANKV